MDCCHLSVDGIVVESSTGDHQLIRQTRTLKRQNMLQEISRLNRILPIIGFGTWELTGQECISSIDHALRIGYRHIDTAQIYHNEKEVGKGINQSGVDRNHVFITTKIAAENLVPSRIVSSTLASLQDLDTPYVDLLLIHWPTEEMDLEACLDTMFELQEKRHVKNIGVSNFTPKMFRRAISHGPLLTNQVHFSPHHQQWKNLNAARRENIPLTAHSPLDQGDIPNDKRLAEIGVKYHKSAAQVALRWLIQLGHMAVIPKAASEKHRMENMEIFDFELTRDDMRAIRDLGNTNA